MAKPDEIMSSMNAAPESEKDSPSNPPLLVIAGYGAGLGEALAHRFLREGHVVVGLSRSGKGMNAPGFNAMSVDLADPAAVSRAFDVIDANFGAPSVLIHTAAALVRGPFLDQGVGDFEHAWRTTVVTAVTCCQQAIPRMLKHGGGSILLTGATASLRGGSGFAPFASAKFALRGLAGSLAREFQGRGIHVTHVVLDGILWTEKSRTRFPDLLQDRCLIPQDIADAYWHLTKQPSSAWTHELDLRPKTEPF